MISEIPEIIDGKKNSTCICPNGHRFHVAWECRHDAMICTHCKERVEL